MRVSILKLRYSHASVPPLEIFMFNNRPTRASISIALLSIALAAPAFAQDELKKPDSKRVPAHTPEWTNPHDGDPGTRDSVAADLQKIVVLCATSDPGSPAITREWKKWLQQHAREDKDITVTIEEVLRRADAHRTRSGKEPLNRGSRQKMQQVLHDTAKAVIQNTRA